MPVWSWAVVVASLWGQAPSDLNPLPPQQAGMDPRPLERIAPLVRRWIDQGQMAGAVVAVGRRDGVVYLKAFGHRRIKPSAQKMTPQTLFDLASLTKPVATATSVMILVEQGEVRLHDPVARYLPEFAQNGKHQVKVLDLLLHQGGLVADNPLSHFRHGPQRAFEHIMALKLLDPPGKRFRYSDVGFLVLGYLVERVSGQPLDQFARKHIFEPLGMHRTMFNPPGELRPLAAATEQREGRWLQGEVHDPRAALLGGVAGHAGLFSTAEDLARFAQMMLQHGQRNGRRVLAPRTVEVMTRPRRVSAGWRALGWDVQSPYSSNRGELMSSQAFGHGGFTGTAMWIDPGLDLFVIFLSNRLHPDGQGRVNTLAGRIGTLAAAAVLEKPSPKQNSTQENSPCKASASLVQEVWCGIDSLAEQNMKPLWGKRVGLITNHTGRDRLGRSTAMLFHRHPRVRLVALFSPEHGLHGKLDVPQIADTQDPQTGLKVFSLYGRTRKPTPEMLRGIDVLVFDIQDIGTRFYTYISTMKLAMEAAWESGVEFVVLDRPNPLGGEVVAGPVLDPGRESFVGCHPLPVRHGMTAGELALMFRQEQKWHSLRLQVIRMKNWRRRMYWDQTLLTWINPSPNMRSPHQALLYPGIGLLETTNLSVGRGTDTPFELIGAPWLPGRQLAQYLSRRNHPGLGFVPVRFTPKSSRYQGQECSGVRFLILDRRCVEPIRLGLDIAWWLRRHCGKHWDTKRLGVLLGDAWTEQAILQNRSLEHIWQHAQREAQAFQRRRLPFLLYE